MDKINLLEQKIKVKFKDPRYLLLALTHRSYLNENKQLKSSNERVEFLGDAILEYWVSQKLYSLFPDFDEGQLTNLRSLIVCTENLADISASFDLGSFILLSRGEATHNGRQNISLLADTFESLIGAIHLDQGYPAVEKFLDRFLDKNIQALSEKNIYKDAKSHFQEIAQSKRGVTPKYQLLSESGPDHQKIFKIGVYLGDQLIASGKGNSKQKAEEDAATRAILILNKN
ncbi:MAG TPA: ribonuclease III [Candidatus Woesebacteria bacterium]|nr:ribonuclease III [Candidatus Woesebacteria bacterium]